MRKVSDQKNEKNRGERASKNCRQMIRLRLSMLAVCLTAVLCSGFFALKTQARQQQEVYKYYTSIQVQSGDTLWSIADQYCTNDNKDRGAFIAEVKELNHIDEDLIHVGHYITIPYYSTTSK